VSPLGGTTVPRSELQGYTVLTRLTKTAVQASASRPEKVILLADSQCVIAAVNTQGSALAPYFANRVSEIQENLKEIRNLCDELEPPACIPGRLNTADIGTRGLAHAKDVAHGTLWQTGPVFLTEPRKSWPTTSASLVSELPKEETKKTRTPLYALSFATSGKASLTYPRLGPGLTKIVQVCVSYSNSWDKVTRILSRIIRGKLSSRERVQEALGPADLQASRHLQFLAAAPSALQALNNGRLLSLGAFVYQGEVWIKARVRGDDLAHLLGIDRLRVVMPEEPLARLVLIQSHSEDHRKGFRDALARSRTHCWIPRGGALARSVVKSCPLCRKENKRLEEQLMGDLPLERLSPSVPFLYCNMDMFGEFTVKDVGGARRRIKCWGVIYVCLST
jgi:hypothetical protein